MSSHSKAGWCGRREFFRSAGRYTLLGIFGAVLAALGMNARRGDASCVRRFVCGTCPKFSGCELPTARKTRAANQEVLS